MPRAVLPHCGGSAATLHVNGWHIPKAMLQHSRPLSSCPADAIEALDQERHLCASIMGSAVLIDGAGWEEGAVGLVEDHPPGGWVVLYPPTHLTGGWLHLHGWPVTSIIRQTLVRPPRHPVWPSDPNLNPLPPPIHPPPLTHPCNTSLPAPPTAAW